ncbi:hypothetical protein [Gordonia polyisoprenivorans]|uniref:hypothetical protein n=1 Tax=Gordonia polyisoprenivorans TaxID=84595 RepID=UPI001AD6A297|nr:hypothetical protein [Gordonia polyisoprenivorans]QTI67278.1 hypothetical protein J6U32_16825 [Gordonia polyisoprenivorans]
MSDNPHLKGSTPALPLRVILTVSAGLAAIVAGGAAAAFGLVLWLDNGISAQQAAIAAPFMAIAVIAAMSSSSDPTRVPSTPLLGSTVKQRIIIKRRIGFAMAAIGLVASIIGYTTSSATDLYQFIAIWSVIGLIFHEWTYARRITQLARDQD